MRNKDDVIRMLNYIGVPMHLSGYRYLIEAVFICGNSEEMHTAPMVKIYESISAGTDATPKDIEHMIRYAKDQTLLNGNHDAIINVFGSNIYSRIITNREFIMILAEFNEN